MKETDRLRYLASFPETNPNPVIEIDMNGRITYLNPVAQEYFPGLAEAGLSHELLVDHRQKIFECKGTCCALKLNSYVSGSYFELYVTYAAKYEVVRIYAFDVTHHKFRSEAEDAALRLYNVIDRLEEGITVSDRHSHFEIFNSKMGDITGYTMKEANEYDDFNAIIYPDPRMRDKAVEGISKVIMNGVLENAERIIRQKGGDEKTVLVSTSIIRFKQEDMFLSVYRDISEHKKADEIKNEFIGMVSHELRTPLSIVREAISIVVDGIFGPANDRQKETLIKARNNVDRLARIINDLLDISKMDAGKVVLRKAPIDISKIAKQVMASFGRMAIDRGIELTLESRRKGVLVEADGDKIVQVLSNLIDNALKFTKRVGRSERRR